MIDGISEADCEICGEHLIFDDAEDGDIITCPECFARFRVDFAWDADNKVFHKTLFLLDDD